MPPRPCLRTLPLRIRDNTIPKESRWLAQTSAFSTSAPNAYPMPAKKSKSQANAPTKGTRALRIKKKGVPTRDAKPPEPGERKALRKRIVLSNTNALDVPGLQDLSAENMTSTEIKGQVLGLPNEIVDSLRAVEAFKVGQGWGYFRRPACLVREEAVELARVMEEIGRKPEEKDERVEGSGVGDFTGQTLRKLVSGERGVGKSVLLLQAMAMAFSKGWVVVSLPEGRDLTIGHTDYAPVPNSQPPQYTQKAYTANLLSQIAKANITVLDKLKTILDHSSTVPIPIAPNTSLSRLAELGATNPDIAWPVFQALWKELNAPNAGRPPILFALDNISHIMGESHYSRVEPDGKLKKIHAHDFVLIKHFVEHISGQKTLANGGIIMAATSLSEHAKSPALEVGLAMAESRQSSSSSSGATPASSSTSSDSSRDVAVARFYSPYKQLDERSLAALQNVEVTRLRGLSKEDAKRIMEYWATSGMVRRKIEDGFVGGMWTVAGQGVVGELEKAVVRSGRC